jgi:hypothetical protein
LTREYVVARICANRAFVGAWKRLGDRVMAALAQERADSYVRILEAMDDGTAKKSGS